jgi:hypothetical protein
MSDESTEPLEPQVTYQYQFRGTGYRMTKVTVLGDSTTSEVIFDRLPKDAPSQIGV